MVENLELVRLTGHRESTNGVNKDDRYGRWEPRNEEDKRLGIIAINSQIDLSHNSATEANEALEKTQHDAPTLWKVLDARDQGPRVGEVLRVGPHADVEAHEPHARRGGSSRHSHPDHKVPGEVHGGADQ
uniref:Uncharacterized protein n=1 Tax=Opuntia streptacantha TaxID=393608 RepID=A0A7C9CHV1_OPUST